MRGKRTVFAVGLLVALFIGGFVSYYASHSPDGLTHVAQSTGFADTAQPHAADHGPLSGYATEGVADRRFSVGIAGVTGALVVLALTGLLVFVVRRRGSPRGE